MVYLIDLRSGKTEDLSQKNNQRLDHSLPILETGFYRRISDKEKGDEKISVYDW